jgi:hypothetical protein
MQRKARGTEHSRHIMQIGAEGEYRAGNSASGLPVLLVQRRDVLDVT